MKKFKAVIFDLGGVVFSSPMQAFAKIEEQHGLEENFLNNMIVRNGSDSAWSELERGLIAMNDDFFQRFDEEITNAGAANFSSRLLMQEVNQSMKINDCMLTAIEKLRAEQFKVAALTNNWIESDKGQGFGHSIKNYFDIFVESAKEGIQKPDPAIYHRTLMRLDVKANECVFLDDIGRNLKSAKALGIHTIKVGEPQKAITELEEVLQLKLI